MIRTVLGLVIVLVLSAILVTVIPDFAVPSALSGVGDFYTEDGVENTGSVNLVTAVVVAYRGLDTLGEVVVLFSASTAVVLILTLIPIGANPTPPSSIVSFTAGILPGAIVLFGIYIVTHGHLSPGGGFPGGAVVASAFLLVMLGSNTIPGKSKYLSSIESLAGLTFGLLGFWGVLTLGQYLNNLVVPAGSPGKVISAGIIPLISLAIGAKVASELSGIFASYRKAGGEE
jgi:multicomponent Na+:H+ antiporter subunit B